VTAAAATVVASARLLSIAIRDFRNLARADLELPPEGLIVIGDNGQGKTNLLEAVYYLELFRSVRGARDQDLVRFGASGFHIAAAVETDRAHEISVGFDRPARRKRARLDGGEPERLSDALGTLPAVMFAPGDVDLVAGAQLP
jgi:DNA replication and repair protein RecF